LLKWQTVTEINNDFFTIERSSNGIDWQTLGKVIGAGNSDRAINYEYMDENPFQGKSYYRLIQHDFDGKTDVIGPRSVTINSLETGTINIYPNPISNKMLHFSYYSEDDGDITSTILNDLGQVVAKSELNFIKGKNESLTPLDFLSKGMYILNIQSENGEINTFQKFIIQ